MKKLARLIKWYAVANTIGWALVGVGVFFEHSEINIDFGSDESVEKQVNRYASEVVEYAFYGWKNLIKGIF